MHRPGAKARAGLIEAKRRRNRADKQRMLVITLRAISPAREINIKMLMPDVNINERNSVAQRREKLAKISS